MCAHSPHRLRPFQSAIAPQSHRRLADSALRLRSGRKASRNSAQNDGSFFHALSRGAKRREMRSSCAYAVAYGFFAGFVIALKYFSTISLYCSIIVSPCTAPDSRFTAFTPLTTSALSNATGAVAPSGVA